jgi:hypothetical protein
MRTNGGGDSGAVTAKLRFPSRTVYVKFIRLGLRRRALMTQSPTSTGKINRVAGVYISTCHAGERPSVAVIDISRRFRPKASIRIRISHRGELEQPAGLPEEQALQEVEKQLRSLGITRR